MKEDSSKRLKRLILAVCIVIALGTGLWQLISVLHLSQIREPLYVTNLDVGKADAAVIRYKDVAGIIDTGTKEAYGTIDAFLKEQGITDIDYMILTHFDKDHVGCAVRLLQEYHIEQVYYPDYVSGKKDYAPLMEELNRLGKGACVSTKESLTFDELKLDILPAEKKEKLLEDDKDADNDMSLLCMIRFGRSRLLFTGDIEKKRMEQLIRGKADLRADWIKLPHHGGFEKNEADFLNLVSPSIAVISTSHENAPKEELLEYLNKYKVKTYNTADGNVESVCDGRGIVVE